MNVNKVAEALRHVLHHGGLTSRLMVDIVKEALAECERATSPGKLKPLYRRCNECGGRGRAEYQSRLAAPSFMEPPEPIMVVDVCQTCDGVGFIQVHESAQSSADPG